MVASALSAGAETSTRLAPAVKWAEALSFAVKMPVHSIAMSTPSSFQGNFVGSRSAQTLILPLPRLIESPSTVTVPGNRPCTESKRSRWALVSTGPRSLIPTTSMSLRPDSAMARSTLRPIRPNPLIATRTAMLVSPLIADAGPADLRPRRFLRRIARFGRARTDYMRGYLVLFSGKLNRNGPSTQALQGSVNRGLSGNSEVLEKVLRRGTGPETVHAHEITIGSDHGVPAPAHGDLDGIAGPEHAHVGHGAQCREVLDRLVGRAVFAEPDRIMGHDIDHAGAHQRRDPHGAAGVVGEHQEGGAVRRKTAMQEDAVQRRGHA